MWPPTGKSDRSPLCCPQLQYRTVAFPGNPSGAWEGWKHPTQELKKRPESRRMACVVQDVCDRVEGYPPVSPQTNFQDPYMENKDCDHVWVQMDPSASFKFWPFLEHVTSQKFGCGFLSLPPPQHLSLCVTTVGNLLIHFLWPTEMLQDVNICFPFQLLVLVMAATGQRTYWINSRENVIHILRE